MSLQATGGARFATVTSAGASSPRPPWAILTDDRRTARGPVAVGGFAFAPDGGASPAWAGFEPASLVVPESARSGGHAGAQGGA